MTSIEVAADKSDIAKGMRPKRLTAGKLQMHSRMSWNVELMLPST
ncbi:hypothetical protein [Mesorhizobium sp. M1B.F.Ca.ET.045.04.1.1]|nr:hypothetical protein [Mesorhizobium sp. M1B.F.Ca.ET.045.04.1.1]